MKEEKETKKSESSNCFLGDWSKSIPTPLWWKVPGQNIWFGFGFRHIVLPNLSAEHTQIFFGNHHPLLHKNTGSTSCYQHFAVWGADPSVLKEPSVYSGSARPFKLHFLFLPFIHFSSCFTCRQQPGAHHSVFSLLLETFLGNTLYL